MKQFIAKKDKELEGKDAVIAKKDRYLAKKDKLLAKKDKQITSLKVLLGCSYNSLRQLLIL